MLTTTDISIYLDEVVNRLENPNASEPITSWVEELAGELAEGFLASRAPDGSKWMPLKSSRPAGHNQGSRPLIDSSVLMKSIIANDWGNIENITDDGAVYGTDVEYGIYHQKGTGNIPARPFVGLNDKIADRAVEMIADHIVAHLDF